MISSTIANATKKIDGKKASIPTPGIEPGPPG